MSKRIGTVMMLVALGLAMSAGPAMAVSSYLTSFNALYSGSTTGTTAWSTNSGRCNVCHSSGGGTALNAYGAAFARQPHGSSAAVTSALQAIAGTNSDGDPGAATNLAEINANAQPGWRSGPNNSLFSLSNPNTVTATGQNPPTTLVGSADPTANQTPVLAAIPAQQGFEGTPLTFQVSATDDGPATALSFSLSNAPTGATLTSNGNGTATFSWTASFTQAGSYSPTITVTDAGSPVRSAQQTVSITIGNTNRPPVLGALANQTATEGQLLSLMITATDPDGDAITFAVSNAPTGATLTNNGNGTASFAWTPTFTQGGSSYSPTVSVTDSGSPARTASTSFTITVNNVNRPPVLSTIGSRTANEGQLFTFTATATDPDGDGLIFSGANLPAGATVAANGTFSWTPTFTQAGNYSVTVIVTDAGSPVQTDSETFTLTVGDVNRPPVLAPIGNKTVNVNELLSVTITASDPDGNALSFEGANLPAGASLVDHHDGTATFDWTPTASQAGNHAVTIGVIDVGTPPQSASETFTITVGSVNRPPVLALIGNRTVNAGQTLTIAITASDPDGGALSFAATGLPTGATLVDNRDGTANFSWTPTSSQVGNYPITVSVTDAGSPPLTDSETFTVTVGIVNRSPVLTNPGNKTVNEGQLLAFTIGATDPDGNTLTFTSTNLPAGATLNATSGAFAWTPSFTQAGSYSVTVTVTDNASPPLSASATFSITVNNVNRPPVVTNPGTKTVAAGQLLAFVIAASDPDGNAVTFTATGLPAGATLNATTGAFSWTPTTGQAGSYPVTVTVTDNGSPPLTSAPQTFTITVSPSTVNRAPVLTNPGNKTVNEGQVLSFTIPASDPDGNALTFASANLPAGATLNVTTGAFSWTPSFTQAGSYPVTVTVTDNGSPPLSASQTFTITVVNVNAAPVLTNPGTQTATIGQLLAFTITASDPDGDALTFASASLPAGATLTSSGTFSWTPTTTQVGSYSVTVTVTDSGSPALKASQTFAITVQTTTAISGNLRAKHDRTSGQYSTSCTSCHGSVLTEQSLNPAIHTAHVTMRAYVPGNSDNTKCRFCHRTVNWERQVFGSLRKSVDVRVCRLCHAPEGPGMQFYRVGVSLANLDGAGFYTLLCDGCHRPLARSSVGGKSASDIRKAIEENKGGMASLGVLTPAEIQAIANALATVDHDD